MTQRATVCVREKENGMKEREKKREKERERKKERERTHEKARESAPTAERGETHMGTKRELKKAFHSVPSQ